MKVAFFTLGCKVNHYETQVLKEQFVAAGFEVVSEDMAADIFAVNSCTVTSSGDKKTLKLLRTLRSKNPNAIICLTGCMPQAYPNMLEELADVDVITGSANRASFLPAVQKRIASGKRVVQITPHSEVKTFEPMHAIGTGERTRAEMKIQDGCTQFCAYCIIPTARGPLRSKPLEDIYTELLELSALGYKEVVLVGINLSLYGRENGHSLVEAVTLACGIDGIERVRLGSVEPQLICKEDIVALSKQKKLCPHFHLALQSGCDETLARMNRRYNTKEYMEIAQCFRENFPDAAITTDVMVGFPSETDEDAQKTMDFVTELKLARAHVFTYSKRSGTAACTMSGQVPPAVAFARSKALIAATKASALEFCSGYIGKTVEVLIEAKQHPEYIEGHTKNYMNVKIPCTQNRRGEILSVCITGAGADGCTGELVKI